MDHIFSQIFTIVSLLWLTACQTTHEVATISDSVDKGSDSVDEVSVSEEAVSGYQGIWFTLGQFSEYGDKYSGRSEERRVGKECGCCGATAQPIGRRIGARD